MPTILPLEPAAGCRVLVTGGARGIGRAIAEAFSARDGRICVLDREPVPDAPAGWITRRGSTAVAAEVEAAFAAMDAAWGGVDAAYANAGIARRKPTLEVSEAEWRDVLDVNLTGVFLTAQAAGRRMVAAGSGVIVALASIYGLAGGPRIAAYCATKAGVANLVRSLAAEWGPHGVRVNALAPGYIETEMTAASEREPIHRRTPLGRIGQPEEIAGLACFLASPAAAYINGAVLPVDGGWTGHGAQTL